MGPIWGQGGPGQRSTVEGSPSHVASYVAHCPVHHPHRCLHPRSSAGRVSAPAPSRPGAPCHLCRLRSCQQGSRQESLSLACQVTEPRGQTPDTAELLSPKEPWLCMHSLLSSLCRVPPSLEQIRYELAKKIAVPCPNQPEAAAILLHSVTSNSSPVH